MMEAVNIAVVGATGAVGKAMLKILAERDFPIGELHLLSSERSAGDTLEFKGKPYIVEDLVKFNFAGVDIALFSAGGSVSAEYAPRAAEVNCIVIDNTSHFRRDKDIPLVIPEVNPEALDYYLKRKIIANPNCSTIQMLVALKPIYDAVGIERINVATYQAVSGAGRSAISELISQTGELLNGRPATANVFNQQIAFNVLPHIDVFEDNGYTKEEMKMVWETQKILDDKNIQINPTAVRVPVAFGHSEALHIETRDKITVAQARKLLQKAPGVKLLDNTEREVYPTAISLGDASDDVFVGRVREDISHPRGLDMWVVADNVRKGAALNAVQIAEILHREYL